MGLFDWLTGNRDPDPAIPAVAPGALFEALLALNDDGQRWRVVDVRAATPGPIAGVLETLGLTHRPDLIAEWKFDDSCWQKTLTDNMMSPGFRVLMRLDTDARVVRSVDHDSSAQVRADGLGAQVSGWRGQQLWSGSAISFDRNAAGKWVKTAESATSTDDIKQPLRAAVERSGWGWDGVTIGRF